MNGMLIAGIILIIILSAVIILTPYFWCKMMSYRETSIGCYCLPFFAVAILLGLGVGLTVFGAHEENKHRLRH